MTDTHLIFPLTDGERTKRDKCERVIIRHKDAFVLVSKALYIVARNKLYRDEFTTFKEYCIQKFGFSDSRARQLISVVDKLTRAQSVLPEVTFETERAGREINGLSNDQLKKVIPQAVENQGGMVLSASAIRAAKQKQELEDALEMIHPIVRTHVETWSVKVPTVIRELNRIAKDAVRSFDELVTCGGYLQYGDGTAVHLSKAKAQDLRDWMDERYQEHKRLAILESVAKRQVEIVPTNIYRFDPQKTMEVLKRELTEGDYRALLMLMEIDIHMDNVVSVEIVKAA
jgi:hypothetical protein